MINDIDIIFLTGTAIIGLLVLFIIYFVTFYRIKQRKDLFEKKELLITFEKEKLKAQAEIQEQTFNHISGEIHDNIGQILSLARMQLHNKSLSQQEIINMVDDLLGKAMVDLRDLSHGLNTENVKDRFLFFIEDLLARIQKAGKIKTSFNFENSEIIQNENSIIVFRMIQEILNNVIKHSSAEFVSINILKEGFLNLIVIQDDGIGFHKEIERGGIGLTNLKNRAKIINGTITFENILPQGLRVKILFP